MASNISFPEEGNVSILKNHKYFRNIYYLSTAIGSFPFLLQRGPGIASYFFVIMSATVTIFVLYCTIVNNYRFFTKQPMEGKLVTTMEITLHGCLVITHSILYITSAATSIWRVRAVRQIVEILQEVDVLLNRPLRKDYDFLDFLCFFLNSLICLWLMYAIECTDYIFFMSVMTTNTFLATSQFSVLSSLISNRLREACKSLKELRKGIRPVCHHTQKMTILSEVHDKLCDASQFLQSFGLLVTVIIIVSFMGLTVVAFFFYNHHTLQHLIDVHYLLSRDPKNFPPTDKILWSLYTLAIIWKISSSSSKLTEKTQEFNQLLYKLIANDESCELIRNEKLLLHLSLKREVVLTACGLFDLDFSLVHSMLAATSSYLVILIQFGEEE
ncbi:Gustatory receptor 31 [Halyomorpha halys]|nr:Gustatory receptor 31 [Halyomorpha halys]